MRGTKAKRLRRQHPDRPNPGRKHGGTRKTATRDQANEWAEHIRLRLARHTPNPQPKETIP